MQVVVNGQLINYAESGKGKNILFLHGWGSDLTSFNQLAQELSNKYRTIQIDLPGFGGSPPPDKPWHVYDYSELIKDFLEKIKVKKLEAIVGHSMGGRIAIKAVAEGQVKPNKLVLIGSAGISVSKSWRNKILFVMAKFAKVVTSPLPTRIVERLKSRLYRKIGSDYHDAGVLRPTFLNLIGEDLREDAGKIQVPTLLIYGKLDTETPVQYGRTYNNIIHHSHLEVIDEAGHYAHHDALAKTTDLIRKFL